ncbi:MAG: MFS transporter [Peptococcaceae bacterium]|jgi:MFS family permease|nr:MFS transporter [Peptococcaceae bacterium]
MGTPGQAVVQQEPTKIWNRAFINLFVANMMFNMGQFMCNSLLPVYADSLGAPAAVVGIVVSTFAISAMLIRLISAPIMDTYNRKYIVVFAAVMFAIAFAGFSVSTSIPWLVGFRLFQGCGMAFGNACCLAMVSDMIPKDQYGSGIGYYSMAQVISQALGPSIGLWLVDLAGFTAAFAFNSAIMLVTIVLILQIKLDFKRTRKLVMSFQNIIAKEALLPTALLMLLIMGYSAVNSFLILFAMQQGVTSNIGLYFTVNAVTLLATRPLLGKLTDKFGLVYVCIPGLFFNILGYFIISWSHTLTGFLYAAFFSAFGQGAGQPAMQALSMKTVTSERRGAASSTNYIGMDIGILVGPIISGYLVQALGYSAMFQIMVFPYILTILLLLIGKNWIRRVEKEFSSK